MIRPLTFALLLLPLGPFWVTETLAQQSESTDGDALQFERQEKGDGEQHQVATSRDDEQLQQAAQQIVERANRYRREQGREEVETDTNLTDAAVYFASYMARTGNYGHTADGQRPSQRARQHGYEYCIVSENIAYYVTTAQVDAEGIAQQFVQGWIDSERHRENLLSNHVQQTGVAIARDQASGYLFAVQMLGRPQSAAFEFRVTNQTRREVQYKVVAQEATKSFTLPARATMTHTRCRPAKIQLAAPEAPAQKVKPNDAFAIQEEEGKLELGQNPPSRESP